MTSPVDDGLEELARDFTASLPERMRTIEAGVSRPPSTVDTAFEKSRSIVHQIRGIGAALGLPDLSTAAARAEEAMLAYEGDRGADHWRRIAEAVGEMKDLSNRAVAERDQGNGSDSTK